MRAIYADLKSETRRVVKVRHAGCGDMVHPAVRAITHRGEGWWGFDGSAEGKSQYATSFPHETVRCPYGQVGDRLWVRETWKPHCDCNADGEIDEAHPLGTCVKYKADGAMVKPDLWDEAEGHWCEEREETPQWRPSIFMPRWASRLTLEITGIRAERLQEITDAGAKAEGVCSVWSDDMGETPGRVVYFTDADGKGGCHDTAKRAYQCLWDSINLKRNGSRYRWEANPWVWVIQFKRVEDNSNN